MSIWYNLIMFTRSSSLFHGQVWWSMAMVHKNIIAPRCCKVAPCDAMVPASSSNFHSKMVWWNPTRQLQIVPDSSPAIFIQDIESTPPTSFYPPIWWPFLPHQYLSELATLPTSFVSGSGLSRLTPSHGFDDLDVIPSNLRWQGKKTQPIFRECRRHI